MISDSGVGTKKNRNQLSSEKNPVPLSVPLKLRLTGISAYFDSPGRCLSYSEYWLVGL